MHGLNTIGVAILAAGGFVLGMIAPAGAQSIDVSTRLADGSTNWKVSELSNYGTGPRVTVAPVLYAWPDQGPGLSIPFTDNDGYWQAATNFTLPATVTSASITITNFYVDDRAVLLLNNKVLTACGLYGPGTGQMQIQDPGTLRPYKFSCAGTVAPLKVSVGFKPGKNNLTIVVNNTGYGISGSLAGGGPTAVILSALVNYTVPATTAPAALH